MGFIDEKYLIKSETALAIYNTIEKLPVIDPHNHANVTELAKNEHFQNPWQLLVGTDHYMWQMLRKRGVPEKYVTGDAQPYEKWLRLAKVFPEIAGNPVYEWTHIDLKRHLNVESLLSSDTAKAIWDRVSAEIKTEAKRPQTLLGEMNVEVMCSTDEPIDMLEDHKKLNDAMYRTAVRPTWRPDKVMNIYQTVTWKPYIGKLETRFNTKIKSVKELLEVLHKSHDYFAENGCRASDHSIESPIIANPKEEDAETAFKKALNGEPLSDFEKAAYTSYILGEIAQFDSEKDWVFQMHIGANRNVRDSLFQNCGVDCGGDISNHFLDILQPLKYFLNRFDDRLKVVLYCLDPGHQTTLAVLARTFGAKVNLGSAWWLNDTPLGMRRQLEYIGSVDLFANFAGMVSDSRRMLSFGARFEVFRRVLSDVLGDMVNYGQIPYKIAESLAVRMSYTGPKEFFRI